MTKKEMLGQMEELRSTCVDICTNLWNNPESGGNEQKSADMIRELLHHEGFVIVNEEHLPHAFYAEYGSGKPVIAVLGEYDALPGDTDLREAMKLLLAEEQKYELLRSENEKTGEQLTAFLEEIKEKKKGAIEIAEKLYLNCTYETFQSAKSAAEEYDKNLVELKSAHEMILRSAAYLRERKVHLEDLDLDMDQIRYDIRETEKQISSKQEERTSILEQLALTDYEAVKDRLDACISWLNAFPKEFQKRVTEKTQKTDEAKLIEANRISNADTIKVYEKKVEFYRKCYEQERGLFYVAVPEEITDDAGHI